MTAFLIVVAVVLACIMWPEYSVFILACVTVYLCGFAWARRYFEVKEGE